MYSNIIKLSVALLLFVGVTSGLNCWKAGLHTRRSPAVFNQQTCDAASKSCMIQRYMVNGMMHTSADCSTEDKDTCMEKEKGMVMETVCYCKTEYCNSASKVRYLGSLALVLGFWVLKSSWIG
ncbi:uncharacterized protein [Lepeophtheirus salmonis]|uniref:Protein sleepless n=1 Tax=Lepeophtheirus salmonis TaxID=72036 RepID=A0A0K2UII6_LEPSM|nr:uncharacterized protein LOC121124608 [Lepeophtheirus salmonis]